MGRKKILISECLYKRYRMVLATMLIALVLIVLFLKNPNIYWYDWLINIFLFFIAFIQLAMAAGKSDCFIEIDENEIGIKLVDEMKPQKMVISDIVCITFLPERKFSIEIKSGTYTFKYRDLKDAEIALVESTLTDFAAEHHIELKK